MPVLETRRLLSPESDPDIRELCQNLRPRGTQPSRWPPTSWVLIPKFPAPFSSDQWSYVKLI